MSEESEGLNFDAAQLENTAQGASKEFNNLVDGFFPAMSIVLLLVILWWGLRWMNRRPRATIPEKFLIRAWPAELKMALLPLLTSYALTHAFAGASVYYNTKVTNLSGEEYFRAMGVGRLFSLTHAHLFAHATMYFIMAVLVQLSSGGRIAKRVAPLVALWAGVFDVVSWWGSKQFSASYEVLSAVTGSAFSLSFLIMAGFIIKAAFWEKAGTSVS